MKTATNRRQQANLKIIAVLKAYCEQHPDVRFCQALENLHIVKRNENLEYIDTYYEESESTLKGVEGVLQFMSAQRR